MIFTIIKNFKSLEIYVSENIVINLIIFFIFSVVWVALLGFGSPIFDYVGNIIWSMDWNNYFSNINFHWCSFYTIRKFLFLEI